MRLQSSEIRNFKYWFDLIDEPHGTVSSCQVYPIYSLFCPKIRYYMITDVFVPEAFRGNEYTVALLMNVMNRLWRKHDPRDVPPFRIAASRKNQSAIRCYEKIFGKPYLTTRRLVYFSSDTQDRKQKRWFAEKIWELFL